MVAYGDVGKRKIDLTALGGRKGKQNQQLFLHSEGSKGLGLGRRRRDSFLLGKRAG